MSVNVESMSLLEWMAYRAMKSAQDIYKNKHHMHNLRNTHVGRFCRKSEIHDSLLFWDRSNARHEQNIVNLANRIIEKLTNGS